MIYTISVLALATGLKGHRFLVEVEGEEKLMEVTGSVVAGLNGSESIELKLVPNAKT